MPMSLFPISPAPRANRRTLIHAVYKSNVFDTSLAANWFSGESPDELPAPLRPLRRSSSTCSQEKGSGKAAKSGYFLNRSPRVPELAGRRAGIRTRSIPQPQSWGAAAAGPKLVPLRGVFGGGGAGGGARRGRGVRPARRAGEAGVRVSHPLESRVLQTHVRSTLLPRVGPVGTIRDVEVQRVHERLRDRNHRN